MRPTFDAGERVLIALTEHKGRHEDEAKDTICLWFDKDADEATRFHAATFRTVK